MKYGPQKNLENKNRVMAYISARKRYGLRQKTVTAETR